MSQRRHTRRARRGYTLIETMMALAILISGAAAIMALHQASTHANMEARELSTATHIARTWIERLRRDSLSWVGQPGQPFSATQLANTRYLSAVPDAGTAPVWFRPVPLAGTGESASFDFYGNDAPGGSTETQLVHFCTDARLEWLFVGQAMRADVRVWWARHQRSTGGADVPFADCSEVPAETADDLLRFHFVHASTLLHYTPPGAP